MAKIREPESQSESEEEASSEDLDSEDSESESEPGVPPAPTQVAKAAAAVPAAATQMKVHPPSLAKPTQQEAASSSGEEEEESGSESGSESDLSEPISSNPGARKAKPDVPVIPTSSAAARKRCAEETEEKDAPKAKKKTSEAKDKKAEPDTSAQKSSDDSKKVLFQRIWSEDDEIAVLQGLIDYASEKKADPMADLNAFHAYIKKNLHVDFSNTQLQDKIRRIRRKFKNNKSRNRKPHEQKAYDLSKRLWGNEAGNKDVGEKGGGGPKAVGSAVRKAAMKKSANVTDNLVAKDSNREGEKSVAEGTNHGVEKSSVGRRVSLGGALSVDERIVIAGTELFEGGKGLEGEEQWKTLRKEEVELYLKRLEVKAGQTRLVLDVLKSAEQ